MIAVEFTAGRPLKPIRCHDGVAGIQGLWERMYSSFAEAGAAGPGPHWVFNFGDFVSEVERHGFELLLRTPCHIKILGRPLPMADFSEKYRLSNK